ncbi:hypothetical protein FSP39_000517 [Pinctada imbricata]|uniref:Uncharacterized protein n=1 Tax=Pinctada imbricata TaxID=66713 RepID=A0AA89BJS4_PINIB|nr:hypothetical protein FSP39_000517 [Pinctada imbricata]
MVRTQILSVVVNQYSKAELLSLIPGLTKHQIDKARKHAFMFGPGKKDETAVSTTLHRQKMDRTKMVHAVEFFSDPSYTQIVSYGTKDMTLDSGQVVTIPHVIRTVMNSTLISLYKSFCNETDFTPLGDSSLFTILKACASSKRTCLKGVDNIAEDGSVAFECLISLVSKLTKSEEWKKSIISKLKNSKIYMKTDYKLHKVIQKEDECAFHCQKWALSDPKCDIYRSTCAHEHSNTCSKCTLLDEAVQEIKFAIEDSESNDKDIFHQDVDQSVRQIKEWRSHILRTVNQDDARQDILSSLTSNQTLIIMDWAMKYLPQMYREKMTDWFGQKGMHWHVTVCIFLDEQGQPKHKTFTHLLDQVKQDYFAVVSLLEHTLVTLKKQLPHIQEAFIRSDNAGCYHCGNMWFSMRDVSNFMIVVTTTYDIIDF